MPFINEYGRIWLLERINKLTEREQLVIALRFGLDDPNHKKTTLREIGGVFGVGRERIRQMEAKALRKLAHPRPQWRWMTERLFIERCLRLDL